MVVQISVGVSRLNSKILLSLRPFHSFLSQCEDLIETTVLSMQTLCSVGVNFAPYVQLSTEDFVAAICGDSRLYRLQNEQVKETKC